MDQKLIIFIVLTSIFSMLQFRIPWRKHCRRGSEFFKLLCSHLALVFIGNLLVKSVQLILTVFGISLLDLVFMGEWGVAQIGYFPLQVLVSVILLDLAIYWQHRIMHKISFLWRLHRLHHSDRELGVTSGFRFHPLEILVSFIFKLIACFLLGVSWECYLVFEMIIMMGSLFEHSNIEIPKAMQRVVSKVVVTPRMHFVHHSREHNLMNQNFGFFLVFWDRIFGTHTEISEDDLLEMELGLNDREAMNFGDLLKDPFT